MIKKKIFMLVVSLAVLLPALCSADLTGKWKCDDNGTYYLRQVGNTIYWYGERTKHKDPKWANVYKGVVTGARIRGNWVDVPKGKTNSMGVLDLVVHHNGNVLKARYKTGGFGGSTWTRAGYHPPSTPAMSEDCVSFDPGNVKVKRINNRYKIVDGSHWLFDFQSKKREARACFRIIKYYHMDQSCFIGRPDPSFKYLLVSGDAPSGEFAGEDCVSLNPNTARVKRINGRWKIVDGNHWIFDFKDNKQEAKEALKVIKKYGFTKSCFVGRPNPSFQYLRK